MKHNHYDVIILGAGPSGASASMYLSQHKIHHLIIDKAQFPRDKICGDALSGKVVYALNKVQPGLIEKLVKDKENFLPSWGITFVAPNGESLDVPFKTDFNPENQAPGFIATRAAFDNFMFNNLNSEYCTIKTGVTVNTFNISERLVDVELSNGDKYTSALLIDATGAHSSIAKQYGIVMEHEHHSAGLRQYYENVSGLKSNGFIELHFINDILPGYFWIFPMTGNRVNVGLGMLSSSISKKKVNLKKALEHIVQTHPVISERFKNAKPMEKPKGWGLPLGSKKRQIAFDRLMICGDAASLIDPFTGEGIGNGMISGKFAGEVAVEALAQKKFDVDFLSKYDHLVYKFLWPELKMSHQLQKMVKYPWLFNFVVNKGKKSKEFRTTLTAMFESVDLRKKFRDPRFYLKLLFNK